VSFTQYSAFFECLALHYLCRPSELENTAVFDFYSKYDVCKVTTTNAATLLPFKNTRSFKHPSFNQKTRQFRQGVKEKTTFSIAKVYQFDFPDTATFQGNLLEPDTVINTNMEQYSKFALLLFHSYRKKEDLMLNKSYTTKLRQLVSTGTIKDHALHFLQHMQDSKSNNLRNIPVADELQRITISPGHPQLNTYDSTNDDDSYEDIGQQLHLNDILQHGEEFDEFVDVYDDNNQNYNIVPDTLSFHELRNKGTHDCGSSKLPDFTDEHFSNANNFCVHSVPTPAEAANDSFLTQRVAPSQGLLLKVLFTHSGKQQQSFANITGQQDTVLVCKPNGSAKSIVNWAVKSNLDASQQRAFEIIIGSFVLSYYDNAGEVQEARGRCNTEKRRLRTLVHNNTRKSNQLICFLHGPGGSGKSAVIDLVVLYSQMFCKYLWTDFDPSEKVIVVTAMTGVAATLLQGETTHSALYLNQKKDFDREQIQKWNSAKMVIIDEISFASKLEISLMNKHLRKLKQQLHLRYGGINVIFCGDLRQLEPVGPNKKAIYDDNIPEFRDWINCYIELHGMWRFKNDIRWGRLLKRIRDGKITAKDVNKINAHLSIDCSLPATIRYACYFNAPRDSINTAIFQERLLSCHNAHNHTAGFLLIFSDTITIQDSTKVYRNFTNPKFFWENFGENDIKMNQGMGRMDPVLKLYLGCRVMLPTNINVAAGQANGTQASVLQVLLLHGQQTTVTMLNGIPVASVFASQVHSVILRHTNTRSLPQTFSVTPRAHSFQLKYRKMKATQLPLLLNNATTGHKLQGAGVDKLFVHNWSNVTNWVYVMLSRVTTMTGLYARKLLDTDLSKYALKPSYETMVRKLRKKKPEVLSHDQYANMLTS
jgi:PIF1-like helicase